MEKPKLDGPFHAISKNQKNGKEVWVYLSTFKFKDIKNLYTKFLSKCKDYRCYQLKIDGGKNIEFKLRMNDIRNIIKQQKKCNIKEIIDEHPFIVNIVTNKKEIANICHLKKKIKNKMDEINEYLKLKYDSFHQKIFTLIQEIIWEKLYETFPPPKEFYIRFI